MTATARDRVPFAELTTLRVGGPARLLLEPATRDDLVATALEIWSTGEEWVVLGGGSNLLVADDGFDGTAIRTVTRGVEEVGGAADGRQRIRVQAGEDWDALVARTVAQGFAGLEALSGIPGSTGASPIQNIGAYGTEVGEVIGAVEFLDYDTGEEVRLDRDELGLGYRTSVFKRGRRGVVLAVDFDLVPGGDGAPVAYEQLAAALGVGLGDRAPVADIRAAVLALRSSKGMVLDPRDPDSVSAGSFFTNPIVSASFARTLPEAAPRWPTRADDPDIVLPLDEVGLIAPLRAEAPPVKLSAAWLIEHSGIGRGFRLPGSRAAVSGKHTLALVNSGGADAAEIAELARYIQGRVQAEHGVLLQPEPVRLGDFT